jgi:NAD(P)-dependent dehydrogenase (short-subunit alcohol dehydrogenase family)
MSLGSDRTVALVTGAGRGIGRAIAVALAREGAATIVNDIEGSVAESIAGEIRGRGGTAIAIAADVGDVDQVDAMVARARRELGGIDVLVNVAGARYVAGEPKTRTLFMDATVADREAEVRLVLHGTFNCTRAVLDHMVAQRRGRIINISTIGRHQGFEGFAIYGAAKAGVEAFTRHLAVELGPSNITVNVVAPGTINTPRLFAGEHKQATDPLAYAMWQRVSEKWKIIPMRRIGEPEDVANAVLFLASDAASWITGQTIGVNGGMEMS